MRTLQRFLADETAGTRRDYITTVSLVSLLTAGTIYAASVMIGDRFDVVLTALKKTRAMY
jgi:Flp pilus assembly pilin Flp